MRLAQQAGDALQIVFDAVMHFTHQRVAMRSACPRCARVSSSRLKPSISWPTSSCRVMRKVVRPIHLAVQIFMAIELRGLPRQVIIGGQNGFLSCLSHGDVLYRESVAHF